MINRDKHNRVSIRIKPGSALDRYLASSTSSTATNALHEMATALENSHEWLRWYATPRPLPDPARWIVTGDTNIAGANLDAMVRFGGVMDGAGRMIGKKED